MDLFVVLFVCLFVGGVVRFLFRANGLSIMTTTVLHNLIRRGSVDDVRSYLESQNSPALVNESNSEGWNAVRVAVAFNRPAILELLFSSGAQESPPRDKDGWTSLHIAAFHGYAECLDVLLEQPGVVPTAAQKDEDGRWPIHCAVQRDHVECLLHLLQNRGDQNVLTSVTGSTALHVAARYGAVRCMTYLLTTERARIGLQSQNKLLRTPLLEAVLSDAPTAGECVALLIQHFLSKYASASWTLLLHAFLVSINNSRSSAAAEFLAHKRFFDVVCQPIVHMTARDFLAPAAAEQILSTNSASSDPTGCWVITPLHRVFLTWNASFCVAFLTDILAKVTSDAAERERRRIAVRKGLLDCCGGLTDTGGDLSPMSLIFSTLNRNPKALITALFDGSTSDISKTVHTPILCEYLDPSIDLIVEQQLLDSPTTTSSPLWANTFMNFMGGKASAIRLLPLRDHGALPVSPGISRTHIFRALLYLSSPLNGSAAPFGWTRAVVWSRFLQYVMDCDRVLPNFVFPVNERVMKLWTVDKNNDSEKNCGAAAGECDLFRSLLEAKVRQLTHFVAMERSLIAQQ